MIWNFIIGRNLRNVCTRNLNKRTKQLSKQRFHPRHATNTRSTNNVQYGSFGLVIRIVSKCNVLAVFLFGKFVEPVVAQLSRCHLYRQTCFIGIFVSIKNIHKTWYKQLFAHLAHKLLVTIRLLASQLEIAMSNNTFVIHFIQQMKHDNRVDATTDSTQKPCSLRNAIA